MDTLVLAIRPYLAAFGLILAIAVILTSPAVKTRLKKKLDQINNS